MGADIMMRVTTVDPPNGRPMLRIEGRLTEATVDELGAACRALRRRHDGFDVDLSGCRFVDAAGATLLARLERDGARLEGRSGLLDELLRGGSGLADGEAALVARLQAGDGAAFESLIRRHGGRLLATARRLVRNEEDARDVVQDAFLAAHRAIGAFQGTARLSTWLHRIVVNEALMRLRRKRRRPEEPIDELLPRFAEDGHFAEPLTPWERDGAALLERRETRDLVRRAIDRLPATYRTVLLLRDIEDLDTEETAERLGIRPNAVKIRLHRARQALRTLIGRELEAGS
jgi:RNA polymerase sigma-70 factor (ECF subfamily)